MGKGVAFGAMSSRITPQPASGARELPPFAQLLREYRERKRKTQEQLAGETKMSRSAISKLERGERYAPYDYSLRKIARALDLSPEEQACLMAAAIQSRPGAPRPTVDARDELTEQERFAEPESPDEEPYGEAPTEPDILYAEGHAPTGSTADTTPLAGAGEARPLTLELWGWRLDILAALTVSVRWLQGGASHMPALSGKRLIALVSAALLLVSAASYAFAQLTPVSAATRPFASADTRGWLIAERQAAGLPALLAVMDARTGAWRPLWPDSRALNAISAPISASGGENSAAPAMAHPRSPAYSPALRMLAFIASASGGGEAIWVARIAVGGDGWPSIQAPGPSLAVADCGGCGALAWSPDGAWLLYDTTAGLRALGLATHETWTLTTDAGDSWPACSPDGRWLAYQHGPDMDGSIVVVAARDCLPVTGAGARARYLNGYFPSWRPAWSPDGALLAFTTYASWPKHGVRAASLKDLSSAPSYLIRTPTVAVSQAGCGDPTWTRQPSGSQMLVFTCDSPTQAQHHGTVVITPGALALASWQAVEDTGANTFQGICWMPG